MRDKTTKRLVCECLRYNLYDCWWPTTFLFSIFFLLSSSLLRTYLFFFSFVPALFLLLFVLHAYGRQDNRDGPRWGPRRVGNFNQNSNLWETKQIEKTHVKEKNHTHKTIFTWFGNLPTSTELQGFHYIRENTIVHKNTLKKPKSQYTLTLSHPQDKKTLFFLLMRLLGY